MRTLSATLQAAQEAAVIDPLIRITFSDPLAVAADVVVEQDKILGIPSQEETSDSQTAELVLSNSDGYFTTLNLEGWDAVFEWGLVTEAVAGVEYSAIAPLKVISQNLSSAQGVLQCRLSLVGIPNLMAEDKASKDYLHHWSDTKTVKAMITEIADGEPVASELTEAQEESDGYIELRAYDVGTADLSGFIKTEAAIGATSVVLKSLGTGTINRTTRLSIEGDSTDYIVSANANIAGNEATVTISPALVKLAEVDTKINLNWRWGTGQTGSIYGAGQRLTISDRTVTKLAFRLKKTGNPTGTNVTFRIRQVAAPQAILASKTFPIASILLSPSVGWCEATLTAPVAVDEDVWLYCEYVDGTVADYVSVSYNSVAVKPYEWFMLVDSVEGPVEYTDLDCAYRYKYTGAGIDCWARGTTPETYCKSYEVYDTGNVEALYNNYLPKDAFRIYEGQSRLDKINQLLGYTGCEKRVEADSKIHIFVPKSAAPYDSEYSLADGSHTFFSKSVREAVVSPNRIVVRSLKTDDTEYSGAFTSGVSFAKWPISDYIRTSLVDDAQGLSIATAMISRLEIAAQRGAASVPMNLGAEVFDYDLVTDSRQADSRTGNLGYIRRSYTPGRTWRMDFSFGRVPRKGVLGTRPSLLTGLLTEQETETQEILTWGQTWNKLRRSFEIIIDNFDNVWGVEKGESIEVIGKDISISGLWQNIIDIFRRLDWLEGQEPTDEQIGTALLPYLIPYLKNVVEDTTPELGGALDCLSHKISGLPAPTVGLDAARKSYVDAAAVDRSKVIWKATSENALTDSDRTASLGFTDLDLTAYTSADAKFAIVRLYIKIDSITPAATATLDIRKNGNTPDVCSRVRVSSLNGNIAGAQDLETAIIGLDGGQVLEYAITIGGTIQVDSMIDVLGYIE